MDTVLVITLTFAGRYPVRTLVNIIVTGYLLKVAYEVLATPMTYMVVGWLKRSEGADAFDRDENFNPFSFGERNAPEQREAGIRISFRLGCRDSTRAAGKFPHPTVHHQHPIATSSRCERKYLC